jgi:hypothetical protein
MKTKFLAATAIWLLFLTLSVAYADPIRIMPLGDSITTGSASGVTEGYWVSYRQKLYLDLVNGGYNIDFVGSLSSGMLAQPAFDIHHEGHGGWCADGCSPPSPPYYYDDIRDHVYTFLTNNPADVVLLHIGTNDISGNHANAAEVGGILDEIYRYSPSITVVLARIISRLDGKAFQTTQFNDAVEALAQSRPEYGDTLILVDMEGALNNPADMADALHPSQAGYNKMADVWLNALQVFLPPPIRLLTAQKAGAGQGRATSNPAGIDCGSACSASFLYGTAVNITATADYGSAFSGWTGCDSTNGNICTITLGSDWTVTATFRLITEELTVQKAGAGQGRVTSLPVAIDCGSACSASFFQGTVVNLTATAEPGSAFSDWTGCDSVSGRICTIALGSNRTVTASFRFTTEVKLLSPNGSEIIPAGSPQYPITWEAPPGAVKFRVTGCSGRRIGTGTVTGNDAMWDVPLLRKNKTNCRAKVTAYDSSNKKIGSDTSDGTFTIEGARITSPNQGDICMGGQTCTITWTKSEHVPAVSTELSYSLKNGRKWTKIPDILPGDAESFDWTVPIVSEPTTTCKFRVVLRDSNGRKVGSDVSDGTFTIQPAP